MVDKAPGGRPFWIFDSAKCIMVAKLLEVSEKREMPAAAENSGSSPHRATERRQIQVTWYLHLRMVGGGERWRVG
jgi:hypothetical protein